MSHPSNHLCQHLFLHSVAWIIELFVNVSKNCFQRFLYIHFLLLIPGLSSCTPKGLNIQVILCFMVAPLQSQCSGERSAVAAKSSPLPSLFLQVLMPVERCGFFHSTLSVHCCPECCAEDVLLCTSRVVLCCSQRWNATVIFITGSV